MPENTRSAQGNMLLGLSTSYREGNSTSTSTSTSNPTQALILAIEAFRHSERLRTKVDPASAPKNAQTAALGIKAGKTLKEEEYYLALLGSSSSGHSGKGEWTETIQQVVKIVSGDPSRGAMSLEMEQPLRVGQKVQVSQAAWPRLFMFFVIFLMFAFDSLLTHV